MDYLEAFNKILNISSYFSGLSFVALLEAETLNLFFAEVAEQLTQWTTENTDSREINFND